MNENTELDGFEALDIPVKKLSKDLLKGLRQKGGGVTDNEARFLVDLYYSMQKQRIHVSNQVSALQRDEKKTGVDAEPHEAIKWILEQAKALESEVAKTLAAYTMVHPMAWFFDQTMGIGPILAAGLLAHIDIRKAPTAGHIINFAGLNPKQRWVGKEGAKKLWAEVKTPSRGYVEALSLAAQEIGVNPTNLIRSASTGKDGEEKDFTDTGCIAALAKKPFNGALKTLFWKIGESFVKVANKENGFYGHLYAKRKVEEWNRNFSGAYAEIAKEKLATVKIGKDTDAYAWYSGQVDPAAARAKYKLGEPMVLSDIVSAFGVPMLPPAHIHSRAKRYAVKMFISHLQECWWRQEMKSEPPAPYVFAHAGEAHAHYIPPPQKPE